MKKFLKGLLAAAAGGAAPVLADPHSIAENPEHVLRVAGAGALIGTILYIAKSPITSDNPKSE